MIDSKLSAADDRGSGGGGTNPQVPLRLRLRRAYHKSGHVTLLK
ncbi:MAG: hypothetical protein U1F83_19095 [Verrucomicrobiota bacterium]